MEARRQNVMKYVECHFLRSSCIAGDAHDQCEHYAVGALVQRMQGSLIAGGDRVDESNPVRLLEAEFRFIGVEEIAERLLARRILRALAGRVLHSLPTIVCSLDGSGKSPLGA